MVNLSLIGGFGVSRSCLSLTAVHDGVVLLSLGSLDFRGALGVRVVIVGAIKGILSGDTGLFRPGDAGFVGVEGPVEDADDDLDAVVAGLGISMPRFVEEIERELYNFIFLLTLLSFALLISGFGFGLIGLNEAMIFA